MHEEQSARLRHFVRSTLGCGCPEEVLQHITSSRFNLCARTPLTRLDVGGRLLVYLFEAEEGTGISEAALREAVEHGVAERDRLGFNRLRIVVAADDPEALRPAVEGSFAVLEHSADRVNLHLVATSDLPLKVPDPGSKV
ncbi:MAG: hypothetical protein ACC742_01695 [Thermoanaerobaculales bacterium]